MMGELDGLMAKDAPAQSQKPSALMGELEGMMTKKPPPAADDYDDEFDPDEAEPDYDASGVYDIWCVAPKSPTEAAAKSVMDAEFDAAGTGEEDFEAGMRQNAMERDAADADQDGKLDFGEFCQFVRDREEGEFTDEELKKRFDALDEDGSGKVDMAEYLQWSLKDALALVVARGRPLQGVGRG